MIIELIEETRFEQASMYAIKIDNSLFKWFAIKDEAERMYVAIKKDPSILKPVTNILKSEEIDVSSQETKQ